MINRQTRRWAKFFAVGICMLSSCQDRVASTPSLSQALASYDRLILKTDADSISLLYAADGDLGTIAHGRDSIRKFLLRFKDFKVLEQVSVIESQSIQGDTGFLSGRFHQETIVPFQDSLDSRHIHDTLTVNGRFKSEWILLPDSGWRIKKFETGQ